MASLRIPCTGQFYSPARRASFLRGWKAAGGYTGDIRSGAPWCCPWRWAASITVDLDAWISAPAEDPYEALGWAYWMKVGQEVTDFLEEERKTVPSTVRLPAIGSAEHIRAAIF